MLPASSKLVGVQYVVSLLYAHPLLTLKEIPMTEHITVKETKTFVPNKSQTKKEKKRQQQGDRKIFGIWGMPRIFVAGETLRMTGKIRPNFFILIYLKIKLTWLKSRVAILQFYQVAKQYSKRKIQQTLGLLVRTLRLFVKIVYRILYVIVCRFIDIIRLCIVLGGIVYFSRVMAFLLNRETHANLDQLLFGFFFVIVPYCVLVLAILQKYEGKGIDKILIMLRLWLWRFTSYAYITPTIMWLYMNFDKLTNWRSML